MDNEEIISILTTMASTVEWEYPMTYATAIEEAIKHMKAWDMIQEELQERIDNEDADKGNWQDGMMEAQEIIEKYLEE